MIQIEDGLNVRVYNLLDAELEVIWKECQALFCHSVFQSYDWIINWYITIGENLLKIQPAILVVSDSRKALAVFPFGVRSTAGVRVLEFLGSEQADYNMPLVHPACLVGGLLEAIWCEVEKKLPPHNVRSFVRLPADFNNFKNSWPEIVGARLTSVAYSTNLPQNISALDERIPARRRADSKRQLKRLTAFGQPKFFFAESDAAHCQIVMAMIAQKRIRYSESGVRDIFSERMIQDFYLNLSGRLGDNGRIHASALTLNGEILATHWGAIYGDRYYWLMPAHAGGEWGKFSVGRLLLEHVMRWAVENGIKVFDFTTGDEEYKKLWCDQQLLIYDKTDYFSFGGMVYVYIQRLITCLKNNPTSRKLITSVVANIRAFLKSN